MSQTKKADHRIVQPSEQDYVEINGAKLFVGPYTPEQRQKYIDIQMELSKVRHPDIKRAQARDAAFHKWRNLVISAIQDRAQKPQVK